MICRSAVKPVFIGLGAAAILAAGGASAIAATPSPSPSGSGTTAPAVGTLEVSVTPVEATVKPKDSFDITTTVKAVDGDVTDVKVTSVTAALEGTAITGTCGSPFPAAACTIGDLAKGKGGTMKSTVTVPEKGPEATKNFKITVTVAATDTDPTSGSMTITYVVPEPSPTPTPTTSKPPPTTTKSPSPSRKPTKPSPTSTSSSGTGGGGGSGGGSGSGSGGGSSSSSGSGTGTGGYVPPSPNSSFDAKDPQVALPPIQAPSPSVAPSPVPGAATPQSRLQGNRAPVAQDVTFERMASTQIAWLAALLVAFSLLLTQVRLGRRRAPAGAAKRAKGSHRRTRRGMFSK